MLAAHDPVELVAKVLVLGVIDDSGLEVVEHERLVAVEGVLVADVVAQSVSALGEPLSPATSRVVLVLDEDMAGLVKERDDSRGVAVVALLAGAIADHDELGMLAIIKAEMLLEELFEGLNDVARVRELVHPGERHEREDGLAEQEEVLESIH